MVIEYLFSSVTNLYGDSFNIEYLQKCVSDTTIIRTEFHEEPYFLNHPVDLVYMGSMMERYQDEIIKELMPYRDIIQQKIEEGMMFLITGNALEIFGKGIDDQKGLAIFNYHTRRDFSHHHNSCFLGNFDNMEMVGFKSCFSYTSNNEYPFIEVEKGFGFEDTPKNEGIHYKNFYGTYLIGPLLVLNPNFTEFLLKELKTDYHLIYEQQLQKAYDYRCKEYQSYVDFKEFKH